MGLRNFPSDFDVRRSIFEIVSLRPTRKELGDLDPALAGLTVPLGPDPKKRTPQQGGPLKADFGSGWQLGKPPIGAQRISADHVV